MQILVWTLAWLLSASHSENKSKFDRTKYLIFINYAISIKNPRLTCIKML